jgi:MFS family permease
VTSSGDAGPDVQHRPVAPGDEDRRGLQRYAVVLRQRGVAAALAWSFLGRLHESVVAFGAILLVSGEHGYAGSGVVLACYGIGGMVSGPVNARLAARFGHAPVLLVTAAGFGSGLVALAWWDAPVTDLAALAALTGLLTPPLTPALRSTLPRLVPAERRTTAYALESTLQEVIFVLGPVLAAGVAVVWGGPAALALAAAATAVGCVGYVAAVRGVRVPAPTDHGAGGRTWFPVQGIGRLLVGGVAFLATVSVASMALVAAVSGPTAVGGAGVVLAAVALGSMTGGVAYGALADDRRGRRNPAWSLAASLVVLAVVVHLAGDGSAPASATGFVVVAVAGAAYGATIAPSATALFAELDCRADGRSTEAFGWMGAAMGLGGAVGDLAGGVVVAAAGTAAAMVLAAAFGAVMALTQSEWHRDPHVSRRPA